MRFVLLSSALFFIPLFPNGVVSAHHSAAEYGNKLVYIDGTIVEYRFRNPHVTLVWDAKDENGRVVRWRGELASVGTVMSHGLTKDSIKPGDNIRLGVYPSKLGTPESVIMHLLRLDGSVILGWSPQAGGSPEGRAAREQEREEKEALEQQQKLLQQQKK